MEKDEQILLESFLFVIKESEEETNKEIRYNILMKACFIATLYQKLNVSKEFKELVLNSYHKSWDQFLIYYDKKEVYKKEN